MKNADLQKIRQALKNALELITGDRIKYDAFPPEQEPEITLEAYIRASEEELEQALALLPCPTCEEAHTTSCPDCQS